MKFRLATAAWSVIYLLLLLTLLTPLKIITVFLLIVPGAVLFSSLHFKGFLIHVIPALLILALLDVYSLLPAIYFLIPAILMGRIYKKGGSSFQALMTGMGVILAELLVVLLFATYSFGFDLSQYLRDQAAITASIVQQILSANPMLSGANWTADDTQRLGTMLIGKVPYVLIVTSFVLAVITHALVRPALSSLDVPVRKMKPAREWRLPRALIWYYLLAIVIEWIAGSSDSSWIQMVSISMLPLIHACFIIQTIGFIYFWTHSRKMSPVIALLLSLVVLVFQPLRIIGIIDLAFPLREAITRSKK
ncbi:YybS family protein [Paenibacillus sp. BJ-4]|uniref:YybS family protein n=1 Tax=Paenibacillus sp. BJ-4 TaxID=2878097 RepID=UPI0021F33B32|nr:YybS family protein [Paenibacillus sp. BJ-4]